MAIPELRAELAARKKALAKLKARRAGLAKQLDAIDRQIAALRGGGRRGPRKAPARLASRRKMPKNVKPLIEYIRDVLAEAREGMRVKDAMAAVQKAGYKTHSKDFYGLVATALRDGPFVKVSRGVYRLKTARKAARPKASTKGAAKKARAPKRARGRKAPSKQTKK